MKKKRREFIKKKLYFYFIGFNGEQMKYIFSLEGFVVVFNYCIRQSSRIIVIWKYYIFHSNHLAKVEYKKEWY